MPQKGEKRQTFFFLFLPEGLSGHLVSSSGPGGEALALGCK